MRRTDQELLELPSDAPMSKQEWMRLKELGLGAGGGAAPTLEDDVGLVEAVGNVVDYELSAQAELCRDMALQLEVENEKRPNNNITKLLQRYKELR